MFKKIQELCQFWESAFEPLCTQHDFYYIQNNILKKYRTPTLNVDGFQLENVEDEFLRVRQCLEQKMPIQYIFNEAFFMDLVLYVDENVLIPRPETEELVFLIEKKLGHIKNLKVLDIGTGSGCIGIYLKRKFPSWRVEALDFSISALEVAKKNAKLYDLDIQFTQADFLDWESERKYDIIVSNPPYIDTEEIRKMDESVLKYEPHLALFAEGDALKFYKKIAGFGIQHLESNGFIFCELNEHLVEETMKIFDIRSEYKKVEIHKDMQGKNRMLEVEIGDQKSVKF